MVLQKNVYLEINFDDLNAQIDLSKLVHGDVLNAKEISFLQETDDLLKFSYKIEDALDILKHDTLTKSSDDGHNNLFQFMANWDKCKV